MEFPIQRRRQSNLQKYHKDELETAYEFARLAYKELSEIVKAIVLYRSHKPKDPYLDRIDILILLDDVTIVLTPEVVESFRLVVEKYINQVSKRLSITTMKLTSFWEHLHVGDPLTMNMLRDDTSLIDSGFYEPPQHLLQEGRIKPTKESVFTYYDRAKQTLHNAQWHTLSATQALYWAAIDAAHAALMKYNVQSPSPEHVSDELEKTLVARKLLNKKYPVIMRNLYKLNKMIEHREIQQISGKQYDQYLIETQDFVAVMRGLVEQ